MKKRIIGCISIIVIIVFICFLTFSIIKKNEDKKIDVVWNDGDIENYQVEDDYEKVVFQRGVIEIEKESITWENDNTLVISDTSVLKKIRKNSIIVIENDNGFKETKRVTQIEGTTMIVSDNVEFEDVVKKMELSDIVEFSFQNIFDYYDLSEEDYISSEMNDMRKFENTYIMTTAGTYQSKGFSVSLNTEDDNETRVLCVALTDNDTGLSYRIPSDIIVKEGTEYSAELTVDKFLIASQFEYDKGVKCAEISVDTHTILKGGVKKEKSFGVDKILLFKTPVPLGSGILGVDIEVYLMISAEGNISLQAEMPMATGVRYDKGIGFRKISKDVENNTIEIQANCEGKVLVRIEPIIVAFTKFNILDMEADMGATLQAEMIKRPTDMICIGASASFPVFTLSALADEEAESMVGLLVDEMEYEIITSDNAPIKKEMHYEVLPSGEHGFVEKCTYGDNEETDSDIGEQSKKSTTENPICRFWGYDLPLIFNLNYTESEDGIYTFDIVDTGEGYLMKGTLCCGECAKISDVEEGNFVTVSGKEYTVEGEESYNNDQRSKLKLSCNDGQTYWIMNLPAFVIDNYIGTPYYVITGEDDIKYQTNFENVELLIPYDTCFSDGKTTDISVKEAYELGGFEESYCPIAYDIHFSEDGVIDILQPSDIGSNGDWYGSGVEYWKTTLE